MPNYEDFKKKAKDALDTIADVSAEAYRIAEEKAKVLAKRAKLSAGIANERALIRRLKVEIGDKYYELHMDAPEEALKEPCEEITSAIGRIADKKMELEDLKAYGLHKPDDEKNEADEDEIDDKTEE